MKANRLWSGLPAVIVLVAFGSVAALAQGSTPVKFRYLTYDFSVDIPSPYQPTKLSGESGGGLEQDYLSNGLLYIVLASDDVHPRDTSASTVIEMMCQIANWLSAGDPAANLHVISTETRQGLPARGFGVTAHDIGNQSKKVGLVTTAPPEIKQMFGSEVYVAIALVPLNDLPAVAAAVGVVGPASRSREVENAAFRLAQTIVLANPAVALPAGVYAAISSEPGHAKPPAPVVKPFNELKKGEIELVGIVKSVDAKAKSLDLLVGRVAQCSSNGALLDPPRLKRVFADSIPADVKEEVVLVVVAPDTGQGKPVTARLMKVMDTGDSKR